MTSLEFWTLYLQAGLPIIFDNHLTWLTCHPDLECDDCSMCKLCALHEPQDLDDYSPLISIYPEAFI